MKTWKAVLVLGIIFVLGALAYLAWRIVEGMSGIP
jgi:hypothetical protein